MWIYKGRIRTYEIETKIVDAINLTLNAVRIVKKGSTAGKVVVGTDGASRRSVKGALVTIGPSDNQTARKTMDANHDAEVGDNVGVMQDGVVNLILATGQTIEEDDLLGCAANGAVKKITFSATATVEEEELVVAVAREDVTTTDAEKAIEAEIVLERS